MYMATGFPWVDKTRRRSCHRRNKSVEIDWFKVEHDDNLSHRGTTLSRKMGLPTREGHGHSTTTSKQNWRELGRVSLDMPMIRHTHTHQQQHHTLSQTHETFLDTKVKKHKPSSPGGRLANFFNSLISQAVSKKKKKSSKSSPQSVKDLVEEDSPSGGWRRRRRSSISHFRSSTTPSSFSAASASRKPNSTPTSTRTKRTSMSDIDTRSIESCSSVSGSRTPPPYSSKNTPIKPTKQANNDISTRNRNSAGNLDWLDEKFRPSSEKQPSSKGLEKGSREFKRFVEEDGAESDSSSDLFELKLNYDHHDQLGYCGGGLPVYETTRMDSIKLSSGAPITNAPFKNG